jgi:hypothetical protein
VHILRGWKDIIGVHKLVDLVGILVDSEIDSYTRNGKSGVYQQDRYQQRPLVNMVDSW